MKLFYCLNCHDIVKMTYYRQYCECGFSQGHYKNDGLHAVISGMAIPLGIDNTSFVAALKNRPQSGAGLRFEAFVIPVECSTVVEE